jgi:hypothetical protein
VEKCPPWEADSRSPSHEISCLLWNPKDDYRVHKSPLRASILNQMNPVHIPPPFFRNTTLILLSHLHLGLLNGVFPSGFPTHISHPPWCVDLNNILWWRVKIKESLIMQYPLQASKAQILSSAPVLEHPQPMKYKAKPHYHHHHQPQGLALFNIPLCLASLGIYYLVRQIHFFI